MADKNRMVLKGKLELLGESLQSTKEAVKEVRQCLPELANSPNVEHDFASLPTILQEMSLSMDKYIAACDKFIEISDPDPLGPIRRR